MVSSPNSHASQVALLYDVHLSCEYYSFSPRTNFREAAAHTQQLMRQVEINICTRLLRLIYDWLCIYVCGHLCTHNHTGLAFVSPALCKSLEMCCCCFRHEAKGGCQPIWPSPTFEIQSIVSLESLAVFDTHSIHSILSILERYCWRS
jgi:hypothetical protein